MTIRDLYQVLDNVTILTKFFIINSSGHALEWGSIYREISDQVRSMPVVHCQYKDGEIIIWV